MYLVKVLAKGKADEKLQDRFGHVVLPGEYYLKKNRSKHPRKKKFTILDFEVYVRPDEVFEPFVEVDDELCMDIDEYVELSQRVSLQM